MCRLNHLPQKSGIIKLMTMALEYNITYNDNLAVSSNKTTKPIIHQNSHILLDNDAIDNLERIDLYKYLSFESMGHILKQKKIFLNKVDEYWEDCYENFLLKCSFKTKEGLIQPTNFINSIYGMSLTTLHESDAMWRIYSNKSGIKIKTNAKKLFSTIFLDEECYAKSWFGVVNYNTMEDIWLKISNKIPKPSDIVDIFCNIFPETEFMKRKEFEHEKEFRVIFMLDSKQTKKFSFIKRLAFSIDIDDFIEEYCLDPRLNDTEYENQKELLIKLGADKRKIKKSNLYTFTPFEFEC